MAEILPLLTPKPSDAKSAPTPARPNDVSRDGEDFAGAYADRPERAESLQKSKAGDAAQAGGGAGKATDHKADEDTETDSATNEASRSDGADGVSKVVGAPGLSTLEIPVATPAPAEAARGKVAPIGTSAARSSGDSRVARDQAGLAPILQPSAPPSARADSLPTGETPVNVAVEDGVVKTGPAIDADVAETDDMPSARIERSKGAPTVPPTDPAMKSPHGIMQATLPVKRSALSPKFAEAEKPVETDAPEPESPSRIETRAAPIPDTKAVAPSPGPVPAMTPARGDPAIPAEDLGSVGGPGGAPQTAQTAQSSAHATSPSQAAHGAAQQIAAALPRDAGVIVTDRGTEVALDPPELGRVRMVVTELAGGLALSITAERQETLDMFRRHAALLQAEFQREGLADTSFSFRDETAGRQSSGRTDGRPGAGFEPGSELTAPAPMAIRLRSGGLDLRL
ncbi:hypothetical protein HKCCE3408_12345 [Rhodobacterales bacterium HKCCE3408]|nr:hypothetical protein [Rhodobacterales bacterium HKCCE3408]